MQQISLFDKKKNKNLKVPLNDLQNSFGYEMERQNSATGDDTPINTLCDSKISIGPPFAQQRSQKKKPSLALALSPMTLKSPQSPNKKLKSLKTPEFNKTISTDKKIKQNGRLDNENKNNGSESPQRANGLGGPGPSRSKRIAESDKKVSTVSNSNSNPITNEIQQISQRRKSSRCSPRQTNISQSFQDQEDFNNTQQQIASPDIISYRRHKKQKQKNFSITSIPDIPEQYRASFNSDGSERCKSCEYQGEMEIVYSLGWVGYSWVGFLALATVVLTWVPFVFNNFKEKEVICPECRQQIRLEKPTCL